jgi:CHAT domain-containing protein/Tfp pilus assembly protein PilF
MWSVKTCTALIVVAVLCLSLNTSAQTEQDARIKQLAEKLTAAQTEDVRQALLAAEKELVTAKLVTAIIESADKLRIKGDYEQALSLARFTQALAEQIGDRMGVARTVQLIGAVHLNRGEYATALELYQKSLPLSEAANYQRGVGLAYTNLGLIYRQQGDFDKALEFYRQGLQISEAAGDKNGIANTLNFIGVIHRLQGNGRLALQNYQKALALFEETGSQAGIAGMLNNIGGIYRHQGQYELAEESFRKSLALAEKAKARPQVAQVLNNIGSLSHRLDNTRALEYYRRSLVIREEIGDKLGAARTLRNIGEAYTGSSLREYDRALDYYQQALALFESLKDKTGLGETTSGIAQLYILRGDYKSALLWSERAVSILRETDNRLFLWQALAIAGAAHRGLKQFDKARALFTESITVIEEMRADVAGGEQERQRFLEVSISPYQALIELLIAEKEWDSAFAAAERAKGRVLLDVLQSGRVNIAKAMTTGEREQERKLRSELVTFNNQITRESQSAKPDAARLADLKARQQKARLVYEGFQTSLYAAHPELKIQRGEMRPISLAEASALLPDARTAVVEYVVAEDKTYLFVLTKGGAGRAQPDLRVLTVDVKQKDLAAQAESFRQRLARRDLAYGEDARKLYDLLLKPAEAQLRGKDTLVIVPDGKLWELPFQALRDARGRHLIESHAVSYAPSLTVLREMQAARAKTSAGAHSSATLLAVGNPTLRKETIEGAKSVLMSDQLDPLPEAEKQVKALGVLYGPERSRIYVGPAAREDRIKAEAGGYRLLQLATHGVLNDASPMYSHVLLAQEDGNHTEDGLLEAWELMNLDLKADLVVLSACETARGHVGAGEGVIGLTWALFVAGSPTTIVSQWKVESASTTELMLEFHRNLLSRSGARARSVSISAASQLAAKKMLATPEYRHPFYWAGFVVVGDSR